MTVKSARPEDLRTYGIYDDRASFGESDQSNEDGVDVFKFNNEDDDGQTFISDHLSDEVGDGEEYVEEADVKHSAQQEETNARIR